MENIKTNENGYYAIKIGRNVRDKIVTSWEECKKYTYEFNSIFKKFPTEEKARKWLDNFPEKEVLRRLSVQPMYAEKRRKEKELKLKLKQEKLNKHRLYLKNKRKGESKNMEEKKTKELSVIDIMEFLNKKYEVNLSESSTRNLLNSFNITSTSEENSNFIIKGSNYIHFKEEILHYLTKKINKLILDNFENILKTKSLLEDTNVLSTDPIFYVRKFRIPSIVVEAIFNKEKIFKKYFDPTTKKYLFITLQFINNIYGKNQKEDIKMIDEEKIDEPDDLTPEPERSIFKKINSERLENKKIEEPYKIDDINDIFEEEFNKITNQNEQSKVTKEKAISLVKENPRYLEYLTNFQDDEDVVLTAVKNIGTMLRFASNRIKDQKEIVREAIESNAFSYRYASKRIKNLPEIYYLSLYLNPDVYKFLPRDIKCKKEVQVYYITNKIITASCDKFEMTDAIKDLKLNLPLVLTYEDEKKDKELKTLIEVLSTQKQKKYHKELKNLQMRIGKTTTRVWE